MRKLAFAFLVATYSLSAIAQNPPELETLYIFTERAAAKIASDPTIQAFGITNPAEHANFIHGSLKNILAKKTLPVFTYALI